MIEIIPNYHPIFVHFTVALLSISVLFYVLVSVSGISKFRFQWLTVARWNLWLGAGFALVTAVFGWLAFNSVDHDDPSHLAMLEHRAWAYATLAMFIPLAIWSFIRHRNDGDINKVFVVLLIAAAGVLMSTGWHGAELVYRHGLGVMSLPKADEHAHSHANGDDHHHSEDKNIKANESMMDHDHSDEMTDIHDEEHVHDDEHHHEEDHHSDDEDNHHEDDDHHHDDGDAEHSH